MWDFLGLFLPPRFHRQLFCFTLLQLWMIMSHIISETYMCKVCFVSLVSCRLEISFDAWISKCYQFYLVSLLLLNEDSCTLLHLRIIPIVLEEDKDLFEHLQEFWSSLKHRFSMRAIQKFLQMVNVCLREVVSLVLACNH